MTGQWGAFGDAHEKGAECKEIHGQTNHDHWLAAETAWERSQSRPEPWGINSFIDELNQRVKTEYSTWQISGEVLMRFGDEPTEQFAVFVTRNDLPRSMAATLRLSAAPQDWGAGQHGVRFTINAIDIHHGTDWAVAQHIVALARQRGTEVL
jgi:hypothetical protein